MNRINILSKLSFIISSTTLEHKITEELKNKKETLTKKSNILTSNISRSKETLKNNFN